MNSSHIFSGKNEYKFIHTCLSDSEIVKNILITSSLFDSSFISFHGSFVSTYLFISSKNEKEVSSASFRLYDSIDLL